MTFLSDTVTVTSYGDQHWVLLEPLVYRGKVDEWAVPAGFVTDFASVPRVAVWLVPRFDRYTRAAILHDWLCVSDAVSPQDADGLFRRVLREVGTPPVQRWLIWCGVRWGALASPGRRAGWWSTAPAVLAVTALALPLLVPMAAVGLGLLAYRLAEWVATR